MKTKLLAVLSTCAFLTSSVLATDYTTIVAEIPCLNTKTLFKTLKEEHEEIPVIYGKTSDQAESTTSLWINPKNKSWTIVATKGDLSCIIGVGTDIKFIPLKLGNSV